MQPRLSCADFSFQLLSHDDALDSIARLGLAGVDVGLFPRHSHFQPRDYLDDPKQGARILCDRVNGRGLQFADIFLQSGPNLTELAENHPDKKERQRSRDVFLRTLELVSYCGACHLTSLPGIVWPDEPADVCLERSAEELAWRVEQAGRVGIVYSIEPHLWSVVATPEAVLRLVDLAPGLTLTLDYGHFVYQGISHERVEPLVAHASHVHARGACRGLLQAPWRKNTIDFAAMLEALGRVGYSGWIGLEYVSVANVPELPNVDTLRETTRLRDFLQRRLATAPHRLLQREGQGAAQRQR